jgi:UDP-N-acetylmuramate: L-alanyl-gamma-D-glutamyl-meso-diaminopimelate ligase
MGSLAGLLAEIGHDVSGSDVAFDPPIGPELQRWGITCLKGYDPAHLEPPPDLVVVGNVCRPDNPEAQAALERGLCTTHIAGALAEFVLHNTSGLIVAGTHGKTTTAAMAAWLLEAAGRCPGFLIGGIPKNFGKSFRPTRVHVSAAGEAPSPRATPFVLEGDEYDTAFFEKTAKFLHYPTEVAVITSVEHDHIDIYPSFEAYAEAFRAFVTQVPDHGLIVANTSDAHVARLVSEAARAPVAWYALEGQPIFGGPPEWLGAVADTSEQGTRFDLFVGGVAAGRWLLPGGGRHNVSNAVAAVAATARGYGAELPRLAEGLSRYAGVRRRQDLLGTPAGVFVYDDFAHHPTAVRETLLALRGRHPKSRLVAVFEPRSATACRRLHQQEYPKSFSPADEVLLAPLGRSGLAADERLDLVALERELQAQGMPAQRFSSIDAIIGHIVERARPTDVIALLSNGAFGGIHAEIVRRLSASQRSGAPTSDNGAVP